MSTPYETPATVDAGKNDWSITSPAPVEETANKLSRFFEAEGYKLESGTPVDGVYGIGSNVMRVLFGAFAKRYAFSVKILESGSVSTVVVDKAMSGAMGGAIGYSKMKKEFARIRDGVQSSV